MSLLFSQIGLSDPVSEDRDGPLLHLLRNYRPDTIGLFLSKEVIEEEERTQFLQKTFDYIKEEWEDYSPKVIYYPAPKDLDLYLNNNEIRKLIYDTFEDFVVGNDDGGEIIVNISSGLPHISNCLHLETKNPIFGDRVKGVQVIMARAGGKTHRISNKDRNQNIDYYLKNNLDNLGDNINRCFEDKIILPTEDYDQLSSTHDHNYLIDLRSRINNQDRIQPYDGENPYVFISYAHKDEVEVKRILKALKGQNIRFWFDENMVTGENWNDSISKALNKSHYIIFIESENFNNSVNCLKEVTDALAQDKNIGIVRLDNRTNLCKDLESYHAITFKNKDLAYLLDQLNRVNQINDCKINS